MQRTRLANERTLLAYLRTAIMLAATGASLLKFFSDGWPSVVGGWLLIAAGAAVGIVGYTRFLKLARGLSD